MRLRLVSCTLVGVLALGMAGCGGGEPSESQMKDAMNSFLNTPEPGAAGRRSDQYCVVQEGRLRQAYAAGVQLHVHDVGDIDEHAGADVQQCAKCGVL